VTLAYGMHSRRKRMFGAGGNTAIHMQEGDSTRVELVYQCLRNLQCLFAFTAGRNTVHDTTVPAAAVICNLLAQQHAPSCLFWRIGPVKQTLHCAAVHG
jgi:hypothetical protein